MAMGELKYMLQKALRRNMYFKCVEQKWEWILSKIKEMKDRMEGPQEKIYDHGEVFLYLGKHYAIVIFEDNELKKDYVKLEGDKLHLYVRVQEEERIKRTLKSNSITRSVKPWWNNALRLINEVLRQNRVPLRFQIIKVHGEPVIQSCSSPSTGS